MQGSLFYFIDQYAEVDKPKRNKPTPKPRPRKPESPYSEPTPPPVPPYNGEFDTEWCECINVNVISSFIGWWKPI